MRSVVATPARQGALLAVVVGAVAIAWYLGSPLFIRTTANEAFPTSAPSNASAITSPVSTAPSPTVAAPRTIASGELGYVDAIHNGKGTVLLIRTGDAVVTRFENVAITNAPDVHVYLSRETGGKWNESTSLYLGALKATNGSFNYAVPQDADPSAYKSAVVWCRQFGVLITWADLR